MKIHYNSIKSNILDVKLDKRKDVYTWGKDNLHPQLLDYLFNASVTAKSCLDKCAKAIYGKSFGKIGDIIVNSKGQTLNELLRIGSREYEKHNNLFIHVQYNGELKVKSIEIIPSDDVRIGKKDDSGYNGKYIIADWDNKPKEEDFKVYDRYNPIKEVIKTQIKASNGLTKWKGQILHIQKYPNQVYSLSDVQCVLNDMVSEINASEFKSNGTLTGFIGTKLMVVQPFANDSDRSNFNTKLKELQGVENQGSVLLLESTMQTEDLDSQVKLEDLTSEHDDKLFEFTESSTERAICKAKGVPLILINPNDSGLFGNSGELLKEAKKQLFEDKEEERDLLETNLSKLMRNFHEPIETELKVINPYEVKQTENAS